MEDNAQTSSTSGWACGCINPWPLCRASGIWKRPINNAIKSTSMYFLRFQWRQDFQIFRKYYKNFELESVVFFIVKLYRQHATNNLWSIKRKRVVVTCFLVDRNKLARSYVVCSISNSRCVPATRPIENVQKISDVSQKGLQLSSTPVSS